MHVRNILADKVHRDFLRRVLGARSRASTDIVMAELGRFPLAVDAKLQLARFWNRLNELPDDRLVKLHSKRACACLLCLLCVVGCRGLQRWRRRSASGSMDRTENRLGRSASGTEPRRTMCALWRSLVPLLSKGTYGPLGP